MVMLYVSPGVRSLRAMRLESLKSETEFPGKLKLKLNNLTPKCFLTENYSTLIELITIFLKVQARWQNLIPDDKT